MEIRPIAAAYPLSGAADPTTPHTVREAAQEFESLFVAKMMETMRRTVPQGDLLGDSSGLQMFREMLDHETARQIAHAGGFGIGEMLTQQLAPDEAPGNQPRPSGTR
jgi:flagellar protein FlgJ